MNTAVTQEYEKLPICENKNNSFFDLDKNKSINVLKELSNKHIIFELWDDNKANYELICGKLLEYHATHLTIRLYDDGSKETKEMWTSLNGEDLFSDWEENIEIERIRGIEKYPLNSTFVFEEQYINKVCEITNNKNVKITALITKYDGYEIEIYRKIKINNDLIMKIDYYPFNLIKKITRVEMNFNE